MSGELVEDVGETGKGIVELRDTVEDERFRFPEVEDRITDEEEEEEKPSFPVKLLFKGFEGVDVLWVIGEDMMVKGEFGVVDVANGAGAGMVDVVVVVEPQVEFAETPQNSPIVRLDPTIRGGMTGSVPQ